MLEQRGALRLTLLDSEGAAADLERALQLAPEDPTLSLQISEWYGEAGRWDRAIDLLDQWTGAHASDGRLALVLGSRCWWRALRGSDLDRALSDCNAALRKGQRNARSLDGRALVWLRLGKLDKALGDYRAAVSLQDRLPQSLYGLGLVESKKGMQAEAERDMKAGIALSPSIGDEYRRLGLAP